ARFEVEVRLIFFPTANVLDKAFAQVRVAQPATHRHRPALLCPGGDTGVQSGAASRVAIDIRRDGQALAPRGLDLRDGVAHPAPVVLAGRLEVVNLSGNLRLAADADYLVNAVEQGWSLAAHVRDVAALVAGRHLAQLDQFLGVGVIARGILQCGRDAE